MAPFRRPVRASDLLAAPEMLLRHPAEHSSRTGSTADEGDGTGFDRMFPCAYAERLFEADGTTERVAAWYAVELTGMGWHAEQPNPPPPLRASSLPSVWAFSRDSDEHLALVSQGPTSYRLSYQVDGCWADGADEPRPS